MSDIKDLLPSFCDELGAIQKEAGLREAGKSVVKAVKSIPGAVTKGYHKANAAILSGMGHVASKHPGIYDSVMDPDTATSVANFLSHHLPK